MALKKIWTSQYRRVGSAVYAESGRRDLQAIVASLDVLMATPGAMFYRYETGSVLAGYVIEVDGVPVSSYIRSHVISGEPSLPLNIN